MITAQYKSTYLLTYQSINQLVIGGKKHYMSFHRSTQPGQPFVGRRNEYQPKGGDALRQGSKGRYGSCVGGR